MENSCKDGAVLHFLKELPVPVWILIFTSMFMGTWIIWQPDFIPRLIDGLVGALLLSLRMVTKPSTNVQADTVNAESVDTASTDKGDINVQTLNENLESKKQNEEI